MKLEANEFCWKPWKLLNCWLQRLFMATCVTWQHMMPVCDVSSSCCFMQMYWGYERHHWVIMFNHVWRLETTTPPDHFKHLSACWILINYDQFTYSQLSSPFCSPCFLLNSWIFLCWTPTGVGAMAFDELDLPDLEKCEPEKTHIYMFSHVDLYSCTVIWSTYMPIRMYRYVPVIMYIYI